MLYISSTRGLGRWAVLVLAALSLCLEANGENAPHYSLFAALHFAVLVHRAISRCAAGLLLAAATWRPPLPLEAPGDMLPICTQNAPLTQVHRPLTARLQRLEAMVAAQQPVAHRGSP
jgi:hypothetical protein